MQRTSCSLRLSSEVDFNHRSEIVLICAKKGRKYRDNACHLMAASHASSSSPSECRQANHVDCVIDASGIVKLFVSERTLNL